MIGILVIVLTAIEQYDLMVLLKHRARVHSVCPCTGYRPPDCNQ